MPSYFLSHSDESGPESDDDDEAAGEYSDLVRGDPEVLLAQIKALPGMDYPVTWVQRSLNRAADDREDGTAIALILCPNVTLSFSALLRIVNLLSVKCQGYYCW